MFKVYIQPYGDDRPFTLLYFTFPIMPGQLTPLLTTLFYVASPLSGFGLWVCLPSYFRLLFLGLPAIE